MIQPPLYPFDLTLFQQKIIFHDFDIGEALVVEGHTLHTILLEHPGQSCGYRVMLNQQGKSFCYITDVVIKKGENGYPSALKNFVEKTGLLIQDAYFNDVDFDRFHHFGHGNYTDIADFARSSNVEVLALYHHNPKYNDNILTRMEGDAQAFNKAFLARERGVLL